MLGDEAPERRFTAYPIGFFHVDIAEVQTVEDKLRLFVTIDRKSASVDLQQEAGEMSAARFLRKLVAAMPDSSHAELTNNRVGFTNDAHHDSPRPASTAPRRLCRCL